MKKEEKKTYSDKEKAEYWKKKYFQEKEYAETLIRTYERIIKLMKAP